MHRVSRAIPALAGIIVASAGVSSANAGLFVQQYGDQDVLGTAEYSSDPTAGATLAGLAPGVVTVATDSFEHPFAFDPENDDHAGTDQIFVGQNQTESLDGYSGYENRQSGPQSIVLDYSSLAPKGKKIQTLTLGIAADDFQAPVFGNPFTVLVNGENYQPLTDVLNSFDQTGPVVQFFTIGLPIDMLRNTGTLTLEIDQGGSGGDGWAIDFLTVGVTLVPTPSATALGLIGLAAMARRRR